MIGTCPTATDLRALLDEELAEGQEAAVLSHVESCPLCQETLERLTVSDVPSVVRLAGSGAPALSPQVPRPTRVGPFRLERELGRGGMGVVYLAHHTRLHRSAALKLIRSGADATPEQVGRFRNEAEALAAVSHPNVIQVFETGEHEESAWIALEYIAGGTLRDRLAGKPLPPMEAARLMAGVARGAAAAHAAGIVHRDLKPGNVLLAAPESGGSHPIPKVTDFGLAKLSDTNDHLTITGTAVGTPHYMPPEQARGLAAGPSADVYAIGAMLYECLTGRPPFDAVDQVALIEQVARQTPIPVRRLQPSVPRDLETVCLKCLEKSPGDRYQSATALADDLDRVLGGRPTLARPVSWSGHLLRWCRRNPVPATLAAGLIGAILLGGAGVTWKWRVAAEAERRAAAERDVAIAERQRAEIAEQEAEQTVRSLIESNVRLNNLVYEAAYRLKSEQPEAVLRALSAGLDRVANGVELAEVRDPKLRYEVRVTTGHGYRLLEKYPEAIRHTTACLADAEAGFGPNSPLVVGALIELATLHKLAGDDKTAAEFRQRGLEAFTAMPDPGEGNCGNHLRILTYWREWAGENELAVRLAERLVADALKRLPPDHRDVLELKHDLAWALLRDGQFEKALTTEREAAAGIEAHFGAGSGRCTDLARDVQTLMNEAGRSDAELFAFVNRSIDPGSLDARLLAMRGFELLGARKWSEAEPLLRTCLHMREKNEPDAWTTANARSMLGECLLGQEKFTEAEPLLLDGYRGIKERGSNSSMARVRLSQAAERLVRLYDQTSRPVEAARWRKVALATELGPLPRTVGPSEERR